MWNIAKNKSESMNNDRKQTDDNVSKKQTFLYHTFHSHLQTTEFLSVSIQRQTQTWNLGMR